MICILKFAIIQGKAETGKTCVINEMFGRITSYCHCNTILLMIPVGIVANNI